MRSSRIGRLLQACLLLVTISAASLVVATPASAGTTTANWTLTSSVTKTSDGGAVVRASFKAPSSTSGSLALHVEVVNASGAVVLKANHVQSMSAGQSATQDLVVPASTTKGSYAVRQGVWDGDWSPKFAWNNQSATFTLGSTTMQRTVSVDSGDPLQNVSFYGPNTKALQQADAWKSSRPADARVMSAVGNQPTGQWFSGADPNTTFAVQRVVDAAESVQKVAVLVAYNIPHRDCGNYSAGGAASESEYKQWITDFAAGIGNRKAVVIVEPDALSQLCGDIPARYRSLNAAVDALHVLPNTQTYIDAGHNAWIPAEEVAKRLEKAGVAKARGFAVNVAFSKYTSQSTGYGNSINAALTTKKRFVIDTSRNGAGYTDGWCNPMDLALGKKPTTSTTTSSVDAYLWIKTVGASDGPCNGGPKAGDWWGDYALRVAKNAGWQ